MTLIELEEKISELTASEKAQLVQKLADELGLDNTGIERAPNIMSGDACIQGTRIPVWLLESYRRQGMSEAEILASYPTLRAADLVNAWAYAEGNQMEIDEAIQADEMA